MDEATVKTDRKWHPFKFRHEVPAKVIASEFDYQPDGGEDAVTDGFIRYRGHWYHVDGFMVCGHPERSTWRLGGVEWQARADESYFSCIVLCISDDGEQYMIGRVTS